MIDAEVFVARMSRKRKYLFLIINAGTWWVHVNFLRFAVNRAKLTAGHLHVSHVNCIVTHTSALKTRRASH